AVVRPDRFAIVERSPGELVLGGTVGRHRPDVVAAVAVSEEGDPLAIGGPGRLARVVVEIRDALRRAAGRWQRPDAALHIDGERAAVWRHRQRRRSAFGDGDV